MKTKLLSPYSHKIKELWVAYTSSDHHTNRLGIDVYDLECMHLLHFIGSGRVYIPIFINEKIKKLIRQPRIL